LIRAMSLANLVPAFETAGLYSECSRGWSLRPGEYAKAHPVDLVLLDVMMPELDGYETLRQLKADQNLRDVLVIMISALDEVESVARCIEHGAEDYLPKPFNPVLLRARTGAYLEKKRLHDQEVQYLRDVSRVTTAAASVEGPVSD
jgi:DNA-binding response OmpR family regulator